MPRLRGVGVPYRSRRRPGGTTCAITTPKPVWPPSSLRGSRTYRGFERRGAERKRPAAVRTRHCSCNDAAVPALGHGGKRSINLLGEPRDVHIARAFVGRRLLEHGVDADRLDCLTVVSELVTNSVVHGRGPIVVDVDVRDAEVVLSVSDTHPSVPLQRAAADDDETGRGLAIIDALTLEWGVTLGDGGKTTYARVPVDRSKPPPGQHAALPARMPDGWG